MGTAVRTAKTSPASWDAFCRRRRLRGRGAGGTRGHGGGRHEADAVRAEAGADWSGAAQGDHGDLVRRASAACSGARSASSATSRSARCSRCLPAGPGSVCGAGCSTGCAAPGGWPAVIPRSRALSSSTAAPAARRRAASTRGFDGGKKIRGVKIHLGVEKYGIPLAIDVSPANTHDTKGIVPVLRELAGQGFRGSALGDLGYRGKRLAKIGEALGITVKPVARGRDGKFLPAGICWVVERSFSWIEPLPSVEHDLRADKGAPRRFHRDRLRFHPLPAPEATSLLTQSIGEGCDKQLCAEEGS